MFFFHFADPPSVFAHPHSLTTMLDLSDYDDVLQFIFEWILTEDLKQLRLVSLFLHRVATTSIKVMVMIDRNTPLQFLQFLEGASNGRLESLRPCKLQWAQNPHYFVASENTSENILCFLRSTRWANHLKEIEIRVAWQHEEARRIDFKDFFNFFYERDCEVEKINFYNNAFDGDIKEARWPNTLTHLNLSGFYGDLGSDIRGVEWPKSLRVLRLASWDAILEGAVFPSSLKILELGNIFDYFPIEDVGWDSVTKLKLGYFDKDAEYIENFEAEPYVKWPSKCEELIIDRQENEILVKEFPKSLKILRFGRFFNHSVEGLVFPETLEELELGINYGCSLANAVFPKGLRILKFGELDGSSVWVKNLTALEILEVTRLRSDDVKSTEWPKSLVEIVSNDAIYRMVDGKWYVLLG